MEAQHKGKITDTGIPRSSGDMVFQKITSAPGVNFRTDYMSKEEIQNESGPCIIVVPAKVITK